MASQSFLDDSTRVGHVVILVVFSFFALLAVIFRLWARKIQRHVWDLSDYLIVVGLIWSLAESIFTIHSIVYWDLGGDLTQYGNPKAILGLVILQVKAMLVGIILWAVAVFLIRASILALYIRIFRIRSFRITCYVVNGINAAFFVSNILSSALICRPIAYNWNQTIPGGTCGDQKSLDLYIGIFNLLLDVCVVVLPMPVLWGLQMAINKKLVLSVMFGLGIIICVITLIRVRITSEIKGSNSQQIYALVALFTCLEALLGVINACLPVLKPLFTKLLDAKPSNWLSSVMSGTIHIFIRPSQIGGPSTWRSSPSSSPRNSTSKYPLPMRKWPGSNRHSAAAAAPPTNPPPRYVEKKQQLSNIVCTKTAAYAPTSTDPSPYSPPPPPVPPKGLLGPRRPKEEPGNWVHREWDLERGDSREMERGLLKGRRGDGGAWV